LVVSQISKYDPNEHEYRRKSDPFASFLSAPNRTTEIQFSYKDTVTKFGTTMDGWMSRQTADGWSGEVHALSGVEVMRSGGGRHECFLHAAFPGAVFYRIRLVFQTRGQDPIPIESSTRGSDVRPTEKGENDHGCIRITSRSARVTALGGRLRIVVAAFAQHTHFEGRVETYTDKPFKGGFSIDDSQPAIRCDESAR
jgi:hypothetical protein